MRQTTKDNSTKNKGALSCIDISVSSPLWGTLTFGSLAWLRHPWAWRTLFQAIFLNCIPNSSACEHHHEHFFCLAVHTSISFLYPTSIRPATAHHYVIGFQFATRSSVANHCSFTAVALRPRPRDCPPDKPSFLRWLWLCRGTNRAVT